MAGKPSCAIIGPCPYRTGSPSSPSTAWWRSTSAPRPGPRRRPRRRQHPAVHGGDLHPGGLPIRSSAGFQVLPDHGLELLERADTVIVPGIHSGSPLNDGTVAAEVAQALRAAYDRGARVMSICTGAFVLAAAGLLDGRPATTHWAYASRAPPPAPRRTARPRRALRRRRPRAHLGRGGRRNRPVPARRPHGPRQRGGQPGRPALRGAAVARRWAGPVHRAAGTRGADNGTAATREWARQRLHEPVALREMAAHARMSVRTFTRHFRSETGLSPAQWLLQQRTEHARVLLETTDLSVDRIARDAGFGTTAALRQHFHARVGVSPPPTAARSATRPCDVPRPAFRPARTRCPARARRPVRARFRRSWVVAPGRPGMSELSTATTP
ncbi:helix-turn-helix domain-containing protein [Micromonospora sp. BRA006-A]|nr:helix-turn-helix domain-containing protein [Micromonospora sp. BRA006-A]